MNDAPLWTTRDYRAADAAALLRLWCEALERSTQTTAQVDETVFNGLLKTAWVRVACLPEGAIIGFAAISVPGHIDLLATATNHEQQGVASALLADLDFLGGAMGAKRITADVPVSAQAFFAKRGFVSAPAAGEMRLEKMLG